jgi:hypothetical protein
LQVSMKSKNDLVLFFLEGIFVWPLVDICEQCCCAGRCWCGSGSCFDLFSVIFFKVKILKLFYDSKINVHFFSILTSTLKLIWINIYRYRTQLWFQTWVQIFNSPPRNLFFYFPPLVISKCCSFTGSGTAILPVRYRYR